MKITKSLLNGVILIQPKKFGDDRGFFYESYNKKKIDSVIGREINFVQDNFSQSHKGVFRGIHYQKKPYEQGKLVSVTLGSVDDYVVDLRKDSNTYLQWEKYVLSNNNGHQLWIPEGFGHAFLATSEIVHFSYKTSDFYNKDSEECIMWNDPKINLILDDKYKIKISEKDQNGIYL